MTVKVLTEFLSLKGGCTGSSESTLVKLPHCWKSHVAAQMSLNENISQLLFVSVEAAVVDKDLISPSPGSKSSLPPRPPTRRGRTTETLSSRLNLPVVTLSHKLIQSKSLAYFKRQISIDPI